jgi:hypothetical protein
VAVEDIVAEDKAYTIISYKFFSQEKGLCYAARPGLLLV